MDPCSLICGANSISKAMVAALMNFIVTILVLNNGTWYSSHFCCTSAGGLTLRANTRHGIFDLSTRSMRLAASSSPSDLRNAHSAPPITWTRFIAKYRRNFARASPGRFTEPSWILRDSPAPPAMSLRCSFSAWFR